MPALMTRFIKNRSGAATIECTLIGALSVIAVISAMALFAGSPTTRTHQQSAQSELVRNP